MPLLQVWKSAQSAGDLRDLLYHEIRVPWTLDCPKGSIVAIDRGYMDYAFLDSLSAPKGNILSDQMIKLPGSGANRKEFCLLHGVVVWDPVGWREIVLLTNNMKLSTRTIAVIYRQHWQIELFLKAIKQNLKIKTFVGSSANAAHIQIWIALISILLLKYLQMRSRLGWSHSNLLARLRFNLFVHRELWGWIHEPYSPHRISRDVASQPGLALA